MEIIYSALQRAMSFYQTELRRSEKAHLYLKGRGVEGRTALQYGLGYAPEGWEPLKPVFNGYRTSEELSLSGLIVDRKGSRRYDRFRDRVMFPILNEDGRCIAFGGRVMGEGTPKYLNSPETAVFQKSKELYGLYQALPHITARRRVLVVEGYMDVIMLAQYGVPYAVGTLGTAVTRDHCQRLLALADEVVFCFDGDEAGEKASIRAMDHVLDLVSPEKSIRFLTLPHGEDPDSLVRQIGGSGFEKLLNEQAISLGRFIVRSLVKDAKFRSYEDVARFQHRSLPIVKRIAQCYRAPLERHINKIADHASAKVSLRHDQWLSEYLARLSMKDAQALKQKIAA